MQIGNPDVRWSPVGVRAALEKSTPRKIPGGEIPVKIHRTVDGSELSIGSGAAFEGLFMFYEAFHVPFFIFV